MGTFGIVSSAQALRGQSTLVQVNSNDWETVRELPIGTAVSNTDGKTGFISFIDYYGNSIKITPTEQIVRFDTDSITPGILDFSSETITY